MNPSEEVYLPKAMTQKEKFLCYFFVELDMGEESSVLQQLSFP